MGRNDFRDYWSARWPSRRPRRSDGEERCPQRRLRDLTLGPTRRARITDGREAPLTPMSSDRYDVAIVGGGPAGLSAALWLSRYLHKVVVVDSGDPRNWETRGINGFLGHQGIRSPALRAIGRGEAEKYGAEFVDGEVETAESEEGDTFTIKLRNGSVICSNRILLAIGIKDVWPAIPGLDSCYGETAHVCPDCDG